MVVVVLVVVSRSVIPLRLAWPHWPLVRKVVAFGLPLLAFEVTNIVLAFGDRVLIKELMTDVDLGHYTAAYNLSDNIQKLMLLPIALAIQPMYMKIWTGEGREATQAFLSKAGALFFLLAIPSIVGIVAVREPLILLLAGSDYLNGANVVPLAFGGYMLYGSYVVLAAGLFLYKQTIRMSVAVGVACVANVLLNLALIPAYGILGAAIATAISYVGLMIALTVMSFRQLPFPIPWAYLLRVVAMSGIMFLAINWIDLTYTALTLAAQIGVGIVVFGGLALGVDAKGRRLVLELLR